MKDGHEFALFAHPTFATTVATVAYSNAIDKSTSRFKQRTFIYGVVKKLTKSCQNLRQRMKQQVREKAIKFDQNSSNDKQPNCC
jgi:hypothetical protein